MQNSGASCNGSELFANRIRFRVLAPLVLVIALLSAAFYTVFHYTQASNDAVARRATAQRMEDLLNTTLKDEVSTMSGTLDVLMRDDVLRAALKSGDRDALLAHAMPLFESIRAQHKITHFYFHDAACFNILRLHKLDLQGDKIERVSILDAARTGKPSSALEQGPTGNCTLRVVYPWFDNNVLIGFVELGKDFNAIAQRIHEILKVDIVVVVEKKFLNRWQWEHRSKIEGRQTAWDEFPDSVVIDKTVAAIPDPVRRFLENPASRSTTRTVESPEGKTSEILFLPLKDGSNRELGNLIVFYDTTDSMNAAQTSISQAIAICLGIGTLLIAGIYLYLGRVERDLRRHANSFAAANLELKNEILKHKEVDEARLRAESALLESNQKLQDALETLRSTQNQIIQQERLRALGEMAGGIAHDLNNSLTAVLGYSDMLLCHEDSLNDKAKLKRSLQNIQTSAEKAASIVTRLREFHRPRETLEKRVSEPAGKVVNEMSRPLRVLVADDEPLSREVMSEYLKMLGHIVEAAADGNEAIEKFNAKKFDMVITDRSMPNMNGDQLAVVLKKIDPGLPVILLSGFGEMMLADGESPSGIDLVIGKPLRIESLEKAISQARRRVRVSGSFEHVT